MATLNPYLNFNGNTEEAFNLYKSVFGGEFATLLRFKDIPGNDQLPGDAREKIMHICLPIGNGNKLMATDALESMGQKLDYGNNFYIAISADSKEEADRLFNGLSAGGQIESPMKDEFWGDYFGMFKDRFGVRWMITYTYNKQEQLNKVEGQMNSKDLAAVV